MITATYALAVPTETRPSVRATDVALVAGLVVIVVGTFLPWLRSGSATRNSYATGGAMRRLLGTGGALGDVLKAWPFVSLACAVAVALVLLRFYPPGAVLAVLAAACAAAAAVVALTTDSAYTVRAASLGPAVTLAGAAVTSLAVLVHVTPLDRLIRRPR